MGVERRDTAKSKVQYHILSEKNQEVSATPPTSRKKRLTFFVTTMLQKCDHLLLGAKSGFPTFIVLILESLYRKFALTTLK